MERYRQRVLHNLARRAESLGHTLQAKMLSHIQGEFLRNAAEAKTAAVFRLRRANRSPTS
jgi:hypothetical protein